VGSRPVTLALLPVFTRLLRRIDCRVPNGSFDACPAAARWLARIVSVDRSTRARRLPDGSLVSLWRIVRRVPGGCPTARSYHFGVSFDACPAAARRLARIALAYRSTRARRLPDGSLVSLRGIVRCVPDGCPPASGRFGGSFDASPVAPRRLAVCPFGLAACPASCPASCPAVAGTLLNGPVR
jgi:hypothetical protein